MRKLQILRASMDLPSRSPPETEQSLLPTANILLFHHIQQQQRPFKSAVVQQAQAGGHPAVTGGTDGDLWVNVGWCYSLLLQRDPDHVALCRTNVAATVAVPHRGVFL